jgi:hypothetical protein
LWRAGCVERRTSGSGSGQQKPTGGSRQGAADRLHRASDGAVIDAKHVRDLGCSPRTLEAVAEEQFATKFTLAKDEAELAKYGRVIQNPSNYAQYLEIDTNDPATKPYWEYLASENHVPHDVRYIP